MNGLVDRSIGEEASLFIFAIGTTPIEQWCLGSSRQTARCSDVRAFCSRAPRRTLPRSFWDRRLGRIGKLDCEGPLEGTRSLFIQQNLRKHGLQSLGAFQILFNRIWQFNPVERIASNAQHEFSLPVHTPALRLCQDGMENCAGTQKSDRMRSI